MFGPIVPTPKGIKSINYKWVFVRKRSENNKIIKYKARLVAKGFSQMSDVDYKETYSPLMDVITFQFMITMTVSNKLDMQLMDVVTA